MIKLPKHLHEIMVTFYDGSTAKYTTAILYGPYGLHTDPAVVEIVDLETGEIIYTTAA